MILALAAEPPTCVVRVTLVTAADSSDAWSNAIELVRSQVGAKCRSVDVHVAADGAVVVLVTLDGRSVVRRVPRPSELSATVDALLVTTVEEPPAPVPAKKAAPEPTPSAPPPPAAPAERRALDLVISLYGGARVGFPGRFISPVIGAAAQLAIGDYRLGAFGEWEASYTSSIDPQPRDFQMDAIAGGLTFGRRIGSSPWFVEGRIGAAVVDQDPNESLEDGVDSAEARLGAFLRLVTPNASSTRARFSLGFEASPTRMLHRRALAPNLPRPPTWGLFLSVGLEGDTT